LPRYDWVDDGYFVTENRDMGQIKRVLIVTMLLNFLASGIKLAAGLATGALSVVADALDSLFDGLSNVAGLMGLYVASKPPDAEHPYGHRKFETIAALSISFLLFLTSFQLLQTAWEHFRSGISPQVNGWIVVAMLVSMLVQGGTSIYELREGRRLKSEILVADALHTRASILVSVSVLGGLGLVALGFPKADAILAAFVALVIAKIGIDVLRETVPVLVDQAVLDPQQIAEIVRQVGGVESFHRVRSRGAAGSAAVDLHVRISPDKTVQEADAIASEIRRRLLVLDSVSDVTVHMEAQREPDSQTQDLFASLHQVANEMGLIIHESWVQRLGGELYLEVHVGVNPELTLGQAHDLVEKLENEIRRREPEIDEVHTHIEMANRQVLEGDPVPADLEQLVIQQVRQVVDSIPSLQSPHHIIVRRNRGEGRGYSISLECVVDTDTPVADAHQLSTLLERELSVRLDNFVDVIVHLEPPGSS
jgi:cation diffusion facilitator family transporter